MVRKKLVSLAISFCLLLIVVAIWYSERTTVLDLFKKAEPGWLFAGFACYLVNYVLRTYRLQVLINFHRVSFRTLFRISCLHGFFSYFLPLRSGDLSLPLLLKKESDFSLIVGSAVLIKTRLLDMISLGFFLATATVFSLKHIATHYLVLFVICSLCLVLVPYAITSLLRLQRIASLQFLNKLPTDFRLSQYTLAETILSFFIWLFVGCTLFAVVTALSIPLSFLDIWFLTAIQLPLQLIPIQGIANAGNHEAGWVAGFSILGITPELGLGFALASHIAIILYVALLGVIGLMVPRKYQSSHY
ncbi:MAG: lysylphosphatidylglycerol synthase transmembrane domain-containing protein [Desulfobulbus oligotrophicus]|jgi:uncharacterized membrane protein YbhN (UPF0104 family)|nr:lysylphosphatidylglycerol synthase transmembrane domain-containing protein [Desulfobulbus oligotrophicus]